jgi:hypothetical protein
MACACGPGQQCEPLKPGCWGYDAAPTDIERDRIHEAICAANPDIDGDLMRHLDMRGVGDRIRDGLEIVKSVSRRRSRFVQGWRP